MTRIGDWGISELVILSGTMFIGWGFSVAFWGFYNLPGKIQSGDLDQYLCRPVNTVAAIIFSETHAVGVLSEMATGFAVVASAIFFYEVPVTPTNFILGLGILFIGEFILILIQGVMGCLGFWLGKIGIVQGLKDLLDEFERYPITLLPRGLAFVLTYVIPMAFLATLPTLTIVGDMTFSQIFEIILIELSLLILWIAIFWKVWNAGKQRYSSFRG